MHQDIAMSCYERVLFVVAAVTILAGVSNAPRRCNAQDDRINARAKEILRARKAGTNAAAVLASIARDKDPSLPSLALGIYLEQTTKPNPQEAAQLAMRCAGRADFFHKAMTQFAVNPQMGAIVDALMADPEKADLSRGVAATILAIYARIRAVDSGGEDSSLATVGRRGAAAVAPPANLTAHVKELLANKNPVIVELALLTAACLRIGDVGEQVAAVDTKRSLELEGAKLLYLARTSQDLAEESVRRVFDARVKVDRRYSVVSPLLSTYDPRVPALCYACEAVGQARAAKYLDDLHKALKSPDIRAQIEAAKAIERIGDPKSVFTLLERLDGCPWPTKVFVLSALGGIPAKGSIEPLIALLDKERGRFRLDVNYALASIFRKQHGKDALGWRTHYQAVKDTFAIDRAATLEYRKKVRVQDMGAVSLGSFYFLSIYSDRFVYVLDISMSMKGEKIANLVTHMSDSVRALKDYVAFNIITFGGKIELARARGMIRGAEGQAVAYFLKDLKLNPPTRSYDAMELACRMPGIDTVMFLSDGAPVSGQIEDWSGIIGALTYFNRYRPMALHTIEFHAGRRNAQMMEQLSGRNYGISGNPDDPPEAPDAR